MLQEIINLTITVSGFVLVMMLIIEYLNVQTGGRLIDPLQKSSWLQIVLSAAVGVLPGCLGSYAVVSLYLHRVLSFGSLVAGLTASFGDEALIMFSMMPGEALKLSVMLIITGIALGLLVSLFIKKHPVSKQKMHFEIHQHDNQYAGAGWLSSIKQNFAPISFHRAILIFSHLFLLYLLLTGYLSHSHDTHSHHGPAEHMIDSGRITFIIFTFIALFIMLIVPDHFLEEHLWGHIIKKHFLRITLWVFGTILFIELALQYLHFEEWIETNQFIILLIALIIGIIPQSGPNLIFISMFAQGSIPFSTVFANSIVHEGHGALPLLAESKKSFAMIKAVKIIAGLIIGITGLLIAGKI